MTLLALHARPLPRALARALSSAAPAGLAPPPAFSAAARVSSPAQYAAQHAASLADPAAFWGAEAAALTWRRPWTRVDASDFAAAPPVISWFSGARLNVTESALDAHVARGAGGAPALTWEGDDGASRTYSFAEVLAETSAAARALEAAGVRAGDVVSVYLPMVPAAVFTMLACARLGAVHSVVFAGFSDAALADRIVDGRSAVVVTADAGLRGGKVVELKAAVDRAVALAAAAGHAVRAVLVTHRAGAGVGPGAPGWVAGRDVDYDAARASARGADRKSTRLNSSHAR